MTTRIAFVLASLPAVALAHPGHGAPHPVELSSVILAAGAGVAVAWLWRRLRAW